MKESIFDINIDYSNDPFYAELWFLSLIALLLLFILVLLICAGRRSRKRKKAKEALKKALRESTEYQRQNKSPNEMGESGVSEKSA